MGAVTVRLLLWMLLLWHTSLFALEVDVPMLLQIVEENRNVVQERLILAKYYKEQKNMLKAELLVDEVLAVGDALAPVSGDGEGVSVLVARVVPLVLVPVEGTVDGYLDTVVAVE